MANKKITRQSAFDFHIRHEFKTFSENHKNFMKTIRQKETKIVFLSGPAGTNKTFLSVMSGLFLLKEGIFDNIVYVRSVVESAERRIGSLPGEIEEKFFPWTRPLQEKLSELVCDNDAKSLFSNQKIECIPVNFARGRTFKNSYVILDEMQNCTIQEITTLLTRFGENSRYVVCGDPMQSDINGKSGFYMIKEKFKTARSESFGIHVLDLNEEDIVRSEILKFIVEVLSTKP